LRTIEEVIKSEDRNLEILLFFSRRFLLEKDGMAFTMTETMNHEGMANKIYYKNHVEACYCVEGEGEVEVLWSPNTRFTRSSRAPYTPLTSMIETYCWQDPVDIDLCVQDTLHWHGST